MNRIHLKNAFLLNTTRLQLTELTTSFDRAKELEEQYSENLKRIRESIDTTRGRLDELEKRV